MGKFNQSNSPGKSSPRLRAKGKTPAGSHIPVLFDEVLACLKPRPGQVVADCTLGYGGHARGFIERIGPDGRLVAFDMDSAELERTRKRLSKQKTPVSFHNTNFSDIAKVLNEEKLEGFDIIFADLGVSSMQIDNPARGISYKNEGPLDMRMDRRLEQTGADLLGSLSRQQLSDALWELSDEPDHELIAMMIVNQRETEPVCLVSQLVRLVLAAKGFTPKSWQKQQKNSRFGALHPAARTFQALRILVNDELASLRKLLQLAPQCLNTGGRLGIISFHSGEDRLVKRSFRQGVQEGLYQFAEKNAIVPRKKEIISNPRCASAKFRWAIKG